MNKIFFILAIIIPISAFSQEEPKTKLIDEFSGSIGVTNNGISFVPAFNLGAPAAIVNLKIAKKRFSFEPVFRFALEGKPWSFLFWFRHQTIKMNRFTLRLGTQLAINFRTILANTNGVDRKLMESRRYLVGEIVPSYKISEKVSVGIYYLFSRGFDDGLKATHFVVTNITFSHISISKNGKYYFNLTPQVYYLSLDSSPGLFTNALITLAREKFPLSIESIVNKKIKSEFVANDLSWNISLVYTFN